MGRPMQTDKIIAFAQQTLTQDGIVKFANTAPHISWLPEAKLSKSMNEALRKAPDSCLNYENGQGNLDLRKQIVKQTFAWKGNVNPDEVVITQGCIEALFVSLMTVTKPGDTIIIERPTYFSIYSIVKSLGLKVIEIDIHPTKGMDLKYLEKCIKKNKISACVFITNFNNPTGYCMSDEDKERVVGLLAKASIPLIEDDIYGELYFQGERPLTCKTFDKKGLVLLCSSLSKTLAPGYRVGWCLPGKYKERFLEIKLMNLISSPSPTQAAIAQFFNSGRYDLHIRKLRKTIHIESIKYINAIDKYFPEGTKISNPKGGFVLWIELNEKIDALQLFYKALEKGISIWPGHIFTASSGFENFIRISFSTPFNKKIEDSLKLLAKLAKSQIS